MVNLICILSVVASITVIALTAMHLWMKNKKYVNTYYDDKIPPRYYITGDKHRNFTRVKTFCEDLKTRKKDVLIILGDSGFNYYSDERDDKLKNKISKLDITLFCLHGNKENRPQNIVSYGIRDFCGGKVYYEPRYPSLLFAIDGEIYNFDGREYIVVGGAHSVDKLKCLENDLPFWWDEMPSELTKRRFEDILSEKSNRIYGILSHTCPANYLPTEMFVSTKRITNNSKRKSKFKFPFFKAKKKYKLDIDRSTEEWLKKIERKTQYSEWFCGHYHIDKQIDKITMLYNDIRPLHISKGQPL